jgi:hypothetical protein
MREFTDRRMVEHAARGALLDRVRDGYKLRAIHNLLARIAVIHLLNIFRPKVTRRD